MLAHFSLWRIRWREISGSMLAIGFVRLARTAAFALLVLSLGDKSSLGQDQRGTTIIHEDAGSAVTNGNYYALVIGIDDYPPPLPKLKTAVADARAVSGVLREGYGFQVQLLVDRDATRANILDAITHYRNTLSPNDNLLIYYAGHGYSDHEADKAYWLPADADSSYSANRIIADDLTTGVRILPARHVLVISDSCYSGGLTRDVDAPVRSGGQAAFINRMLRSRSRTLMASGGDEPVSDTGTNGHSVFAYALLRALERTEGQMFTASDMFYGLVQQQVAGKSEQLPMYSVIRDSSHDEGDFVFSRKTVSAATLHASGAATIDTPNPRPIAESPVKVEPAPTLKAGQPSRKPSGTLSSKLTQPIETNTRPEVPAVTTGNPLVEDINETVLPGTRRTNPKDDLAYIWIPPGSFTMGCSEDCQNAGAMSMFPHGNEQPPVPIQVNKGFWLGETVVTQDAFKKVTGRAPSYFKGGNLPVEQVTWQASQDYCKAIGGRLPTEIEWEYTARFGNQNGPLYGPDHGKTPSRQTHDVGQDRPNSLGVHDMQGNVSEWTIDWFANELPTNVEPLSDSEAQPTRYKTVRGSSFNFDSRVSWRRPWSVGTPFVGIGFRCVVQ